MKYVKRCLVLLLALMMTMALVQPAPTAAKYTTASSKTVDIALDTMQETYTIKNVMKTGNFSNVADGADISGYKVNTNKEQYAATNGMAPVADYIDISLANGGHHRKVWTQDKALQVEDTDVEEDSTHNIWIYASLNTSSGHATEGHLYYLRARYFIEDLGETGGIKFRITDDKGSNDHQYGVPVFGVEGEWSYAEAILPAPSTFNAGATGATAAKNLEGLLRIGGDNATKTEGTKLRYKISHIMLVDLTGTFGAGNEPPLWWCNTYIPWDDETISAKKTVRWFPEASMSRLDTAFHNGTVGYYYDTGDYGYFKGATQYRKNDGTVDTSGNVTVSGMEHINSTTLNNP